MTRKIGFLRPIGTPTFAFKSTFPPRYITCLDLGRSGAVITEGWERRIEKTGIDGKAVKRWINTQIIYPPADGTAEALLASSSTDLAERTHSIGI